MTAFSTIFGGVSLTSSTGGAELFGDKNPMLDVLQMGDDGEGHDDEKGPRAPFAEADCGPSSKLAWVAPDCEECRNIFGKPNEEADQNEREQKRHLPIPVIGPVGDRGPGI